MATFYKASDLVKSQRERMARVVKASDDSTMKVAEIARGHAVALTSGPPLKRKRAGKLQFKRRGLPIGEESGELARSWRVRRTKIGSFYLTSSARHAPFVLPLSGKRDRGFWREMSRRVIAAAREVHQQGLRRALKG
jgi:hypothetical protein